MTGKASFFNYYPYLENDMKRNSLLFFGLMLLIGCGQSQTASETPLETPTDTSLIEYTGRIDFFDPLAPQFSNSGVSIRAGFTGTSISVSLNDDGTSNYYNAILDGEVVKTFQTVSGLHTYPIASGIDNKVHEIEIFKLTEQYRGKTKFIDFNVDEGASLVEISNKRDIVFEFVGNSITCGEGNQGVSGGAYTAEAQNHFMAYPAIVSRHFNARHLVYCYSGTGLYRNYGDTEGWSDNNMLSTYAQVYRDHKTPIYDFQLKPDLVCINLGTNDFTSNQGDPEKFIEYYIELIKIVQEKNDNPEIICLLGPMNNDAVLRNCLKAIVKSANKLNESKVYFFEMSHQTGDLGIGVGGHPTIAQHQRNAEELINFISSTVFNKKK